MYIKTRLLRTFMVLGLAAATSAMAQRDDRYTMGVDEVLNFGAYVGLPIETENATLFNPLDPEYVPFFYVVPQNPGDPMDESSVELVGELPPSSKAFNAIKLNTEGDLLEMRLTDGVYPNYIQLGLDDIYIDTKMQFVPSEDAPSNAETEDAKIALYVDAETSMLVVRHGMPYDFVSSSALFGKTRVADTMTNQKIDTNKWYDVQVVWQLGDIAGDGTSPVTAFKVLINGVAVKVGSDDPVGEINEPGSAFAELGWAAELATYLEYGTLPAPDGIWFISAIDWDGLDITMLQLGTLGFKGTGAIADISVSTTEPEEPDFIGPDGSAIKDPNVIAWLEDVGSRANFTGFDPATWTAAQLMWVDPDALGSTDCFITGFIVTNGIVTISLGYQEKPAQPAQGIAASSTAVATLKDLALAKIVNGPLGAIKVSYSEDLAEGFDPEPLITVTAAELRAKQPQALFFDLDEALNVSTTPERMFFKVEITPAQ